MQKIARQRVQREVDSLSTRCLQDLLQEAVICGPEDVGPLDAKVIDEVCSLGLGADSCVNIRPQRLCKLQGREADIFSGVVYQNRLPGELAHIPTYCLPFIWTTGK